jgi:Ca2+ transporting ATPase
LNLEQHLICLGFGVSTIFIGVLVRLIPARLFRKIQMFKENEVEEMDNTLTSKLRRKSSVRMPSSMTSSVVDPVTGQRMVR